MLNGRLFDGGNASMATQTPRAAWALCREPYALTLQDALEEASTSGGETSEQRANVSSAEFETCEDAMALRRALWQASLEARQSGGSDACDSLSAAVNALGALESLFSNPFGGDDEEETAESLAAVWTDAAAELVAPFSECSDAFKVAARRAGSCACQSGAAMRVELEAQFDTTVATDGSNTNGECRACLLETVRPTHIEAELRVVVDGAKVLRLGSSANDDAGDGW